MEELNNISEKLIVNLAIFQHKLRQLTQESENLLKEVKCTTSNKKGDFKNG